MVGTTLIDVGNTREAGFKEGHMILIPIPRHVGLEGSAGPPDDVPWQTYVQEGRKDI